MFKKLSLSGAVAALALTGFSAQAADTANVNVTLDVQAGCSVFVGAPNINDDADSANLDFGSVQIFGSGQVSQETIQGQTGTGGVGGANTIGVTCGDGGDNPVTPSLRVTSATNDDEGIRRLLSGTNYVPYTIHSDAARDASSVLDNGDLVPLDGSTASGWSAVLYGKVTDPAAIPAAGQYADTIVLTLSL